jgi:hypothetical protein
MIKNSCNFINTDKTIPDARKIIFVKFVGLFIVFVFLVLAANTPTVVAQTIESPLLSDLCKTLGFIMGQRFTLNLIKAEYPNLALQAQVAESEFESSFSNAEKNIKNALQEILKEECAEFLEIMEQQVNDALSTQQLNQEVAARFIAEVELRARGEMPSPILETLLTYQFINWPMEEFTLGYSRIFRTKNHSKAKDVDFQVRYPISWRPEEGERPNTIQTFTSENGRGLEMFLLMVKDIPLPLDYTLTEQDLDDFFVESELKKMVPEGAKNVSAKTIVLDNHKGAMIIYDHIGQRLDIAITSRTLHFITILGGKIIWVSCYVSALPGEESELKERFNRFEPLFKMIGNTFIIQEQYK